MNSFFGRVVTRVLIGVIVLTVIAIKTAYRPSRTPTPAPVRQPVVTRETDSSLTLAEWRRRLPTSIFSIPEEKTRPQADRGGDLQLVRYNSSVGPLWAHVSNIPKDGKKHPAIIWLHGGFDNGIGDTPWAPATPDNDQSGSAFWKAGVVTMYPSYRGGNDNPGRTECLFGEADDVIAAADYLAKQPGVDPDRIYLAGHSVGGTLCLLVAEQTKRFRNVFAFGPIEDIRSYGEDSLPIFTEDQRELELRSPIFWLDTIASPVSVIEGEDGNVEALRKLQKRYKGTFISFRPVPGATHFSTLAPITKLIATKILADAALGTGTELKQEELDKLFGK